MDSDITIHVPAEYFDALSDVISTGLQRAKINTITRNELIQWWEAESALATEHLSDISVKI
jgi:hypothetical protein